MGRVPGDCLLKRPSRPEVKLMVSYKAAPGALFSGTSNIDGEKVGTVGWGGYVGCVREFGAR